MSSRSNTRLGVSRRHRHTLSTPLSRVFPRSPSPSPTASAGPGASASAGTSTAGKSSLALPSSTSRRGHSRSRMSGPLPSLSVSDRKDGKRSVSPIPSPGKKYTKQTVQHLTTMPSMPKDFTFNKRLPSLNRSPVASAATAIAELHVASGATVAPPLAIVVDEEVNTDAPARLKAGILERFHLTGEYAAVDGIALSAPKGCAGSVKSLVNHLTYAQEVSTRMKQVRSVFRWICANIRYAKPDDDSNQSQDADEKEDANDEMVRWRRNRDFLRQRALQRNGKEDSSAQAEDSPAAVLKSKETTPKGFANLFHAIMKAAGFPCIVIQGWCKQNKELLHTFTDSDQHFWNAVLVNEEWHLFDSFWSASTWPNKYDRNFSEAYFAPPAECLKYSHLPRSVADPKIAGISMEPTYTINGCEVQYSDMIDALINKPSSAQFAHKLMDSKTFHTTVHPDRGYFSHKALIQNPLLNRVCVQSPYTTMDLLVPAGTALSVSMKLISSPSLVADDAASVSVDQAASPWALVTRAEANSMLERCWYARAKNHTLSADSATPSPLPSPSPKSSSALNSPSGSTQVFFPRTPSSSSGMPASPTASAALDSSLGNTLDVAVLSQRQKMCVHLVLPWKGEYELTVSAKRLERSVQIYDRLLSYRVRTTTGVYDIPSNHDVFVGYVQPVRVMDKKEATFASKFSYVDPLQGYFDLEAPFNFRMIAPENTIGVVVASNGQWYRLHTNTKNRSESLTPFVTFQGTVRMKRYPELLVFYKLAGHDKWNLHGKYVYEGRRYSLTSADLKAESRLAPSTHGRVQLDNYGRCFDAGLTINNANIQHGMRQCSLQIKCPGNIALRAEVKYGNLNNTGKTLPNSAITIVEQKSGSLPSLRRAPTSSVRPPTMRSSMRARSSPAHSASLSGTGLMADSAKKTWVIAATVPEAGEYTIVLSLSSSGSGGLYRFAFSYSFACEA
jgi:Transglutaminase-like superfamily